MENTEKLVEIRCPFKKKSKKYNKLYICNTLCHKIYPPGKGEAYCKNCKLAFEYDIESQSSTDIFIRQQVS